MSSISHRYVLEDLEELAREKTQELEELIGQDLQLQWPPKWDLRDWEIDWFMRAYREYSLFELKPRIGKPTSNWPSGCPHVGYAGPMILPNAEGKPYVHEFLVSWERPNARLHSHEYFTQFSAVGELVGIYGQPAERLLAELPLVREDAGVMRSRGYAIDLAVLDGSRPPGGQGKPVIGAEIKRLRKDHQNLIASIGKCRGLLKNKEECGTEHNKCRWIRQTPSVRYLWVRSQDEANLFEVRRAADTGFDLEPVPDSQVQGVLSRQNWS